MLSFAMVISHIGADPVSIKAEENYSAHQRGWLDAVPYIGIVEETSFQTFISHSVL